VVSSAKWQIGKHNNKKHKNQKTTRKSPGQICDRHREKTAKQNKKTGPEPKPKTPATITEDLPSDTGGMSHRVIKTCITNQLKSSSIGQQILGRPF
jgi:hypothetical protein